MKAEARTVGVVLTADIVNSTGFEAGQTELRLRALLDRLQVSVNWLLRPEIFRGDSFQGVLRSPGEALFAAVLSRAVLKSEGGAEWDLRMAIGIGSVSSLSDRPGTSDGEAFRLSGQLADVIKSKRERIAVALPGPTDPLQAHMLLLESVIEKWTTAQADVIVRLLAGRTMRETAEELKMSQSAVSQHAQAAKWWAVEPAIKTFGQLINVFYAHD